ncbi:MAG: flagellar filament capping protein FliD [Lachnospiraceae bacterium]|nr:flagellar filament capping protein FliD [Lachnospiraceae bacterium]
MGSDLIRMTGMISGMDTESIIKAYTSKTEAKLKKARNSKTLNTWTQDAWKDMNSKIYSFYSKTLSTARFSANYKKLKTTTSNNALSVTAGENAVAGAQNAQIKSAASAAYFTGASMQTQDGSALKGSDNLVEKLGVHEGFQFGFKSGQDAETKTIQIGGEASDGVTVVNNMDELVAELKKAGVNANYDESNQRLFVSAKETGEKSDFDFVTPTGYTNTKDMAKLGLLDKKDAQAFVDRLNSQNGGSATLESMGLDKHLGTKIDGSNAKLVLNGAEFESQSNTFSINGSTYTINHVPSDPNENITINTATDYDGVYDAVKSVLKEYNSLINEMTKLYNADSSKGYDPLTDEQKEAMSEKEVEEWEKKIKDSLLRNDDNLSGVIEALTSSTYGSFEVKGKQMTLADFGIATQDYFTAEKDERNALHIDGDPDDDVSADKTDKLKAMIASDPEAVTEFFQKFAAKMYDNLYSKMGSSSMSSIYKVYNDKQLKEESTSWDTKILELEDRITAIEDKWYSKFGKMESKLAKMQKNQTAVSGFFS